MKKIFAILLAAVVTLTAASCSWWITTPIEHDSLPDPQDTASQSVDTLDFTELPDPDDVSGFAYLGNGLQFHHLTDVGCTLVYNDDGAWMFDYMLCEVTPLVDFESMLATADPTGRSAEYFENVALSVDCEVRNGREIRVVLSVSSNTAEASYALACYYTLNDEVSRYVRGDFRGYYIDTPINHPGSDEPIVISDLSDWGKLIGYSYDHTDTWLYKISKAFVELDIAKLEEFMSVESGTLNSWKDAVISDYTIIRHDPTNVYFDEVTIRFTLAEGSLGRWHSDWANGEYVLTVFDGPGQFMRLYPADGSDNVPDAFALQSFVKSWVGHRGGWYPTQDQVVENSGYMHHLVDFYLSKNNFEYANYEEFLKFCEDTFGLENVEAYVSRDEVENHGGHGTTSVLCDVELEASLQNNYIFEVIFWADVTETVPAKYYEIHVTDRGDGEYTVTDVRCTLDSGFGVYAWGM